MKMTRLTLSVPLVQLLAASTGSDPRRRRSDCNAGRSSPTGRPGAGAGRRFPLAQACPCGQRAGGAYDIEAEDELTIVVHAPRSVGTEEGAADLSVGHSHGHGISVGASTGIGHGRDLPMAVERKSRLTGGTQRENGYRNSRDEKARSNTGFCQHRHSRFCSFHNSLQAWLAQRPIACSAPNSRLPRSSSKRYRSKRRHLTKDSDRPHQMDAGGLSSLDRVDAILPVRKTRLPSRSLIS